MSTAAAMPPANDASAPGLSEGARIWNTFFDPPKAFSDIRRSAKCWLPFLLIGAFSYVLVFAAGQKIGFEQIAKNQIRMNPSRAAQIENLPADQRASAYDTGATFTKIFSYGIPLEFLIIVLITAAILLGTFNFGMGAEIEFTKAVAVVMYANLPAILKSLLAAIAIYAGAPAEGFIFQNPIASNLAALVDFTQHPVLYTAGSTVDLFTIWIMILTGIGFSCISKIKRSTALAVVFGWYFVLVLFSVAMSAAFA